MIHQPYGLDTGLISRSISFENPTGHPARAARRPATWASAAKARRHAHPAGETVQLCDIEGPGTIRHIWMTTERVRRFNGRA